LGHAVGDEVLVGLSRWLSDQLRSHDLLIRHGGDEFVVAVSEGVEGLSYRLAAKPIELLTSRGPVEVWLNTGQARFPEEAQTLDHLLRIADERMYRNKGKRDDRATPYV
jgi:diguanylate cyclase (GGDEF)-like protein